MRVDISGGEPTMRKDLPRIVEAAQSHGLAVVVSTNGLVLNPSRLSDFPDVRWHVSLDSGLDEVHELSRLLPVLKPSFGSLRKAANFLMCCAERGLRCRAMTCIGVHNREALFTLGEKLALWGVTDWNISRVLKAGRALAGYESRYEVDNDSLLKQVNDLRHAFPFIRIRYSNRTEQDGYFLLVLPDGSLATQYTDGRDKVPLGNPLEMTLADLQDHREFDLSSHGRKWIAAELEMPGRDDRMPLLPNSPLFIGGPPRFGIL
jgi:MoaA/NifB/PqqE/SkfB family radical SAM enzyme